MNPHGADVSGEGWVLEVARKEKIRDELKRGLNSSGIASLYWKMGRDEKGAVYVTNGVAGEKVRDERTVVQ